MRLFAAIPVPPELHASISKAAEPLRDCLGVKLLPPDNWHLTLRFIGDASEKEANDFAQALSSVKFSPFLVRLAGAGAYPNIHFPRAVYIGGESAGAENLASEIEKALQPFGLRNDKFSVHVTVARSKGAGDIHDFLQKTREVGQFEARSFVLMKSHLLPMGASYEVLREYPAEQS
jgi:2'-5' RNA ligase